jgi:hypothetical protein
MSDGIKSGKEVLDEFFGDLSGISGVDADVAEIVVGLYQEGKLTSTNLSNALLKQREDAVNDKD